jgi:pimeloyl-ACP methyl ester carboxylesterase
VTAAERDATSVAASVDVRAPNGATTAVALVLSGGRPHSFDPTDPGQLTAVRMRPFARHLHRHGRRRGLAVWTVRYRYRGWNGAERSPVVDVEWALDEVRRRHGDVPVVLVGHSMGGRASLAVGGDRSVRGICALAPWTERDDPVDQLVEATVLIVHGSLDTVTSPRASLRYARRAAAGASRVGYISLRGEMHAMVFRWSTWHRLATGFTLGVLGLAPMPRRIDRAFTALS